MALDSGAPPGREAIGGPKSSGLNAKLMGLPAWAWIALAAAAGVGTLLWVQNRRKSDTAQTVNTDPAPAQSDGSDNSDSNDEAILAQVRDLQGGVSQANTSLGTLKGYANPTALAAPTQVKWVALTTKGFSLAWNPVPRASGYVVNYSTPKGMRTVNSAGPTPSVTVVFAAGGDGNIKKGDRVDAVIRAALGASSGYEAHTSKVVT